jgi:two-component system, sensor histidine kinase
LSPNIILVGDATSEALEPMRLSLENLGFSLHVTTSVADALTKASEVSPVAFLVDISFPEINGAQACGLIKSSNQSVPVIALNQQEPALHRAALAAGADKVIDYPVNWTEVRDWLTERGKDGISPDTSVFIGRNRADVMGTAALLGHDLKSPISMIISTLEVLVSMYEGDENMAGTIRLLRGALSAAYRQLNMIGDWLDLARLETDAYEMELQEVDLAPLLHEVLDGETYALTIKKLRLVMNVPKDKPLMAKIDLDLMRRAIMALVDNSIKFTTRDDVLQISANKDGDEIVMKFSDNGRPIFPGFERQIMERAPQWEGRQAGTRTSVSMGLPFVYAVALAHDGDFTAKSDPTSGITTFTFKLPALKQAEKTDG